jgi:hypothetical protein
MAIAGGMSVDMYRKQLGQFGSIFPLQWDIGR